MLITPERVFYAGLLAGRGNAARCVQHLCCDRRRLWLTTADGRQSHAEMVAVLRTSGTPSPAIIVGAQHCD